VRDGWRRLLDRNVDGLFSPVANDLDRDCAFCLARERVSQRCDAINLLIADGNDYITGLDARFGR
jgi:hypothetical protein